MFRVKNLDQKLRTRAGFYSKSRVFAMIVGLLAAAGFPANAGTAYPLKVSANNRYLTDAMGKPFLMVGDSAWSLLVNVNGPDTAYYFQTRASEGFNTVLASLVCVQYTGGRSDASMLDGTVPFTNSINGQFDLALVNPAYFLEVSNMVQIAATNGLVMLLDPLETGGFLNCATTNGPAKCLAYGQFVGNFFKGFTNIVWMNGNDYEVDTPDFGPYDACITNVAWGIKTTAIDQLQSIEVSLSTAPADGMEDASWWPIMNWSQAYSWSPPYGYVLAVYNRTNYMPEILGEGHYENESIGWPPSYNNTEYGTPLVIREQVWWTMLSGGCGHLYGNHYTWTFPAGWQSDMATPAVSNVGYATTLLLSYPWWKLTPDTNHLLLTSGYGSYTMTGRCSTNDYVTAAATPDGSLMLAYLPAENTVTVNLAQFSGGIRARWFDPTAGTYATISGSPFANAGTQVFTPPGGNAAGDADWVLVLDTVSIAITDLGNGSFELNGNGIPGLTYRLQSSPTLNPANWQDIPGGSATADSTGAFQYTATGGGATGFYRVVYP